MRVAVIGAKESGKTVFLTSLINHLIHHDKDLLDLGHWSVSPREEDISPDEGISPFRYADAREQLSKGEWPDITKGLSLDRRKIRFEDDTGRKKTVSLELLDLPGERVADLSMVDRSFQEWSAWMERWLCGVDGLSRPFVDYKEKIASANDRNEILSRYKDCVARQYLEDGLMSLSPSILRLGVDGLYRYGKCFRKEIDRIPVGTDEGHQFAPLPAEYFSDRSKARRGIVRDFEKAYDLYKAAVVNPIAKWLLHADKAIYLVDVLSLLRRDLKAYSSEKEFARQALTLFRSPRSDNRLFERLLRFAGCFVRTRVDDVIVVATKADTVVGDRNRSRMRNLASGLVKDVLRSLGVSSEVCSCASVDTAEEYGDERALNARIDRRQTSSDAPLIEETKYRVSDVPEDWAVNGEEWNTVAKSLDFRPTFPKFAGRPDLPPDQLGLDLIVKRLFSL